MKCFYINLDNSVDRRNCIEENFAMHKNDDWPLNRFSAIDKKYVEEYNIQGKIRAEEKGCFLSHRELIKSQLDHNENIFILEDDAIIGKNTFSTINIFLQNISVDWDILYTDIGLPFASIVKKFTDERIEFDKNKKLKLIDLSDISFTGTTAYIINGKSKEKIFNLLNSDSLDLPIDIAYLNLIRNKNILAFVTSPFVTSLSEYSNNSLIQDVGFNNLIYDTFRKSIWLDRDLNETKPLLNEINKKLTGVSYEPNSSFFHYAYQINKLFSNMETVDFTKTKEWFIPINNDLKSILI